MISISTITADTNGNVNIHEQKTSDTKNKTARVSITKTLDGGVYINNAGPSHGDRVLSITGKITAAQESTLTHIFEDYVKILLSMEDGFYLAVIKAMNTNNGQLTMTILIEQQEN